MLLEPQSTRSPITPAIHALPKLPQRGWPTMNQFTLHMDKYTDEQLDAMCLNAENQKLKQQIKFLEAENLKLKNELLELSSQMEGMIYED